MKIALLCLQKSPKTFSHCPNCGCDKLIHIAVDQLCSKCDWDTTYAYVQRGGMDSLMEAFKESGLCKKPNKLKEVV